MLSFGRRGAIVLTVSVATIALLPAAARAVTLDPASPVSPPNAWTAANALGRTNRFLNTAWASDCPPPSGACATDSGPYMGVFWQRGLLGTSLAWRKPVRISGRRQQASRPAVAASGTDVYVAWVTRPSYLHPRASDPRVLWIRVSRDSGRTWGSAHRMSRLRGRVDFPVIAASGSHAWLVWTRAETGEIRLSTTGDDGANWTTTTIGTTTDGAGTRAGFRGYPAVGASGQNAAAVWIANGTGRLVALTSSSRGSDWTSSSTPVELLASGPRGANDYPAARGAGDGSSTNVAIAYATSTGVEARLFDGLTLTDASNVAGPWPDWIGGVRFDGGYGPAVAPFGTNGIAVGWAGCRHESGLANACAGTSSSARIDTLERESSNGGSTWSAVSSVAIGRSGSGIAEAPSLEADGNGSRWFVWLRRSATWSNYRVMGRTGTAP
jgi:hypothetical protein